MAKRKIIEHPKKAHEAKDFRWLDKHNERSDEEQVRLGQGLSLRPTWMEDPLWHLSQILLHALRPSNRLYARIAQWQHSRRVKLREKLNGPW